MTWRDLKKVLEDVAGQEDATDLQLVPYRACYQDEEMGKDKQGIVNYQPYHLF